MPYYVDNFKPESVELYKVFKALPEGGYNASIEQAEIKDSFGADVIALRFRIHEPNLKYNNRVIFINLNINSNYPDQEIRTKIKKFEAQKLNQICTVCNAIYEGQPLNLENLLNKPLHIHLGIKTSTKNKQFNTLYGVGKKKEPREPENYLTNNDYSSKNNTDIQNIKTVSSSAIVENANNDEIPF